MNRHILHLDMDAFFASVEQLDNPELRGKPVIVGGTGSRGVVSTCSYEARRFGVHSAMPVFMARKKCPQGIFLPPRHDRYKEVSRKIFDIFKEYTPLVEPLSIDEAFLDVTHCDLPPEEIARQIKNSVLKNIGLTLSIGVSYNKFLAKIASSWNKPDGLFIITPDMVPKILLPLKVDRVYGIGEKAANKLNSLGIHTIGDLYNLDMKRLEELFGKQGNEIYQRIRGIDNRPVVSHREAKSVGRETTLDRDTRDKDFIIKLLFEFSREISATLYRNGLYGRTVTIKLKTSSFRTTTKSRTLQEYIRDIHEIYGIARSIVENVEIKEDIRLVGISVSNLTEHPVEQISLFNGEDCQKKRKKEIDRLVLELNEKLGKDAVKFGIEL